MFPYIYIFGRKIPMYGIMAITGIVAAVLYYKLREKKTYTNPDSDLCFIYSLVGTFIGAKVLYLLQSLPEFIQEFPYIFSETSLFLQKYMLGGFVFYGGLYGCLFSSWLYCRKNKISYSDMLNLLFPTFPLIHAFGRLGCFFMGCCYGAPTDGLCGIIFAASEIAPNHVALIPVQLYESIFEFILFAVCAAMSSRKTNGNTVLGIYLVSYAVFRFVIEYFRGDEIRGFIGPLSVSQTISIPTFIIGIVLLTKTCVKLHNKKTSL